MNDFKKRSALSLVLALTATNGLANDICMPPLLPYLATTQAEADEFGPLIAEAAERYFQEAQEYLSCLDLDRDRVFQEAREFADQYAQYINAFARQ